jgi:hypothetical protein
MDINSALSTRAGFSKIGNMFVGQENPVGALIGAGQVAGGAGKHAFNATMGTVNAIGKIPYAGYIPRKIWSGAGAAATGIGNLAKLGFKDLPTSINTINTIGGAAGSLLGGRTIGTMAENYMNTTAKVWEGNFGKRKSIGAHIAGGALLGGASAFFRLNPTIDLENARRVDESGSAYEGGSGAFGSGSKLHKAPGNLVMGAHNRRHG